MAEGTSYGTDPRPAFDFPFAQALRSISSQLEFHGFLIFSPFTERHGSWEITFHRSSGDIDRTISIAFTSELAPGVEGQALPWRIEIWIGAEQDQQYMRRMVRQFTAIADEFNPLPVISEFEKVLEQSIKLLSEIQTEDLIARYPKRRHQPGERRISVEQSDR